MSYLHQLTVDTLKIDQVFINGICDSDLDRTIVELLLRLGDSLGLKVVAEGVDSEDRAGADGLPDGAGLLHRAADVHRRRHRLAAPAGHPRLAALNPGAPQAAAQFTASSQAAHNRRPGAPRTMMPMTLTDQHLSPSPVNIAADRPPTQPPSASPAPLVDIVIPVYNEASVLAASVTTLRNYLHDRFPFTWRITIADNASTGRWRPPWP